MSADDDQQGIEWDLLRASAAADVAPTRRKRRPTDPDVTRRELPYITPAAKDALRPILTAGLLSRCQRLAVVCPSDHILLRVVGTPAGMVLTGDGPQKYVWSERAGGDYWEVEYEQSNQTSRIPFCAFLDAIPSDGVIRAQCRCRTAAVTGAWLRARIGEGRGRVVHTAHRP